MRALFVILMALIPCLAQADVSFVYPQQVQCVSRALAIQISGSRMRFDSQMDGQKYSMVFDGSEEIITALDHSNRRYHQIEVDEDALDYDKDVASSTGTYMGNQLKSIDVQMKKQCAEMEKQGFSCANMPDLASLIQNAQANAGQAASVIEIKPSSKKQTIAGMVCQTIERYENDKLKTEECYVAPDSLRMSEKDKKYLLRNLNAITRYGSSFSGLSRKIPGAEAKAPKQIDPADKDVLLSQVCFATDGGEAGRIEVQVSNAAIAEENFTIPPGYQKMSMIEQ